MNTLLSEERREEILWVIGGVDCHGAVTGRELKHDAWDYSHKPEEKVGGCSWRWCPNERRWAHVWGTESDNLKGEKLHAVQNWLVKRGYALDEDFE